jgi:hypothetical protein
MITAGLMTEEIGTEGSGAIDDAAAGRADAAVSRRLASAVSSSAESIGVVGTTGVVGVDAALAVGTEVTDWAATDEVGRGRADGALGAFLLAGPAECAELLSCVAELPEPVLSAQATAPLNAAAPTPSATARPPTRPMKPAALMTAP